MDMPRGIKSGEVMRGLSVVWGWQGNKIMYWKRGKVRMSGGEGSTNGNSVSIYYTHDQGSPVES